jgi:uncharacterized protein YcaQ
MPARRPVIQLSWRQVLAYRLSKHHLIKRARKEDLTRVVADICGVQAQLFSAAELAIWARVHGVRKGDLEDCLWNEKTLIKTWGMRGTLHIFSSDVFSTFVHVLGKTRTGYRTGAWQRAFRVSLDEIDRIIVLIGNALDRDRLTREELADLVAKKIGPHLRDQMLSGWGEFLKPAAYNGNLAFGPPRDGKTTFVRPDRWLKTRPKEENFESSVKSVLSRYLEAYGPATNEDFARWWGIDSAPARRLFESMGAEITQVDVEGYLAWVLTAAIGRIQKVSPVNSVRLLPNFDSYVLGFRPRDTLVPKHYLPLVFRQQGWISPVLLVDGRVVGTWELEKSGPLHTKLFTRLTPVQKRELKEEAGELGEFLDRKITVSETKL